MTKDTDCVVVFRDTPERIIQEEILHCFDGMMIVPMFLVCDKPEESDVELSIEVRDEILRQNPPNRSVWLRDRTGHFVLAIDPDGEEGRDFLAGFYQSEVMKKITALTNALQWLGVRSYEVHASEEATSDSSKSMQGSFDLSGNGGVATVNAGGSASKSDVSQLSQKINRAFKFSQAEHKKVEDIDLAAVKSQVAKAGVAGLHILDTLMYAIADGANSWDGLEVEESLTADICSKAESKMSMALKVSARMASKGGDFSGEAGQESQISKRMLQSLTIAISNKA